MKATFFGTLFAGMLAWVVVDSMWEHMDRNDWPNVSVSLAIASVALISYLLPAVVMCIGWRRCGRHVEDRSILIDQNPAREVLTLRVYRDVG